MRRWIIPVILIALLGGGYVAVRAVQNSRSRASVASFQTEAASTGSLTATIGATGSVRTNQSAILSFQTTGVVERVHVSLGERVREGDLLATLVQTSLPSQVILAQADLVASERALDDLLHSGVAGAQAQQALAQAQDALEDAEYLWRVRQQGNRASNDTIEKARADLALAEREVDLAQQAYDRVAHLPNDNPQRAGALSNLVAAKQRRDAVQRNLAWYLGSPGDVEQALLDADLAFAQARLADAQREWERIKDGPDADDLRAAEARVAAAQATLELSRIEAPFEGRITSIEVKPGDSVGVGTLAFRIDDLSRLLVDVDVSEVDINRIELGQQVILNFDAILDRSFSGEVVEIGYSGSITQGVVNFKTTVVLLDADEDIKPGMTAAVTINVDTIENVLRVPNRAVRVVDGKRVVYLLRGSALEAVNIQLGVSSESYSEVLSGDLRVGDRIVLNPPLVFDSFGGPPPFVTGGGQ